ncbi:glycosyltransferase [Salinibacterium sp. ZJ454]|uniref:glycosyltransferase family 2 protein n=1 Tax=Salinibacterium sp. ZJ454 TaxID=2708339 RepID=UPI001421CFEE|nr:glycosyltransferase [Salinibacterium sp. ZJ454]
MHPRVTAILVARDGAGYLNRTIEALGRQSRRPDSVIGVDAGSSDSSGAMLGAAGPVQIVRIDGRPTFGTAIGHALRAAAPAETENEWLWLLAHDNAPEPRALERLLGAVEIAPTVAVAGPKLMRADDPVVIAEYGETLTALGASVAYVTDELDQAQHDTKSDVMGVAANGMLVRRSVWEALGGFDPGLPSIDAALDFSVRARLAGHRVVGVPDARVTSAGGPALFGRDTVTGLAERRIARAAQLHRRLVYAPAAAVPVHWLSLVPLAILRSLWHLLAKHPGAIPGEFATAFAAAFAGGRVLAARRNLARTRRFGWPVVAPLRMRWDQLREHRAHERAVAAAPAVEYLPRERPDFFSGGGAWIVLLAAVAGAIAFSRFAGSPALEGGGLLPLSGTVTELWSNAAYGWRDIGAGFAAAADPFAALLAVLGSLAFWAPSAALVALYLVALPLAALGAWWAAARFSTHSWGPNVAGLLWAFAPPFLSSLTEGHLGAVIAHLLLPWLVLAAVNAARSWSAAASAGLLFAAVIGSAPVLAPSLLLAWVAGMIARPTRAHRLAIIPIPAIALFAPLVFDQLRRGTPWALLAEPGLPTLSVPASGWQLALGAPQLGLHGWTVVAESLGFGDTIAASMLVAVLLAPLGVLALLALFLPGAAKAAPALAVALLGFVTAVFCAQIELSFVGADTAGIWPGASLSLYWLGLTGAAVIALGALGRFTAAPALIVSITGIAAVVPLLIAPMAGTSAVTAGDGRMLPAYVTAEAQTDPSLGTLILTPTADGGFAVDLQRGLGATLDAQSTLAATDPEPSAAEQQLAELAANLAVPSGYDPAEPLADLQIAFLVLRPADSTEGERAHRIAAQSLDANSDFVAVGQTANGLLWRYDLADAELAGADQALPVNSWGTGAPLIQAIIVGLTLLLALPTGRGRRRSYRRDGSLTERVPTFDEEDARV